MKPRAVFLAAAALACAGAAPAAQPRLILSRDAYWRCWYRRGGEFVSPALLATEGKKYMSPKWLANLIRNQKKGRPALGSEGPYYGLWDNGPPPGAWMKAEFDASEWPRCRRPDYMGRLGPSGSRMRALYFRGTFVVPDPASGEVTFRLVYRGGARVFLNGEEIAREHLPAGELADDVRGAGYPVESYIVLNDEFTPDFPKRGRALWPEVGDPAGFDRWQSGPGPADKKAGRKRVGRHSPGITRATVGRLLKLRDRVIGPVTLPRRLLRRGPNILAVETRGSDYHPVIFGAGIQNGRPLVRLWAHLLVKRIEVRSTGALPSAIERPAGVQVWVEDVHARVFSSEYLEPGAETGAVRIVAARNGTFAAQVVVGTDHHLTGLTATPSDLKAPGGATIPASACRAFGMAGNPVKDLLAMGMDDYDHKPHYQTRYALARHGPPGTNPRRPNWQALESLRFFDHLTDAGGDVPADTSRPIWLSLRVPADAAPGRYRGSVRVDADGMDPVRVPMEVEVIDWPLPDAGDFTTVVAAEQAPYGVAKQYGVEPWSDRHFARMEPSFRLLARLGNDWLFVPVISNTEFANRRTSPIRWIRRKDGSLAFDYAVLDRYLDLAIKHWGKPRVISFVIAHGNPCATSEVEVFHQATGKTEPFDLGVDHMEDTPEVDAAHKKVWKAFATSLSAHMKARHLEGSMYWGYTWDAPANRDLMTFLRRVVPGVYWTRGSHYAGMDEFYRAVAQVYGFRGAHRRGWRCPTLSLQNSRRAWFGSYVGCAGVDTPFLFRNWPEQTLTFGQRGLARIGVDYWGVWRQGCEVLNMKKARGRTKGTVGFAINAILWPGPNGAEPSTRLEALVEGLQEAEARVFLERALDGGKLPAELAGRIKTVLWGRSCATALILSSTMGYQNDYCWQGWRTRSRALYRLAADVAGTLPPKKEP